MGVAGGEGVHDLVQQGVRGVAEQSGRLGVAHTALGRAAEQLVEHRQRVAHRAGPGAHHQRQHGGLHRHALRVADLREVRRQNLGRHQPERVVVGAGADRPEHLVGLGGREDELHVGRRLLHHLQQGVETLLGDHVGLVHDVDLVAAVDGREEGPLAQVAGVVHAAVGGRVDLDDVDRAGAAAGQIAAGLAFAAGHRGGPLGAVEGAGEDAGRGGLAAAARAGEQVGVVDPVVHQRPLQRVGDVFLADHLREGVRTVAAVQGQWRIRALDRRGAGAAGVHRVAQGGVDVCLRASGQRAGVRRLLDVEPLGFRFEVVEQPRTLLNQEIRLLLVKEIVRAFVHE